MPAEVRPDMSNVPPALVMKRALPPVLVPVKVVDAPLLVVTVTGPAPALAELAFWKAREEKTLNVCVAALALVTPAPLTMKTSLMLMV